VETPGREINLMVRRVKNQVLARTNNAQEERSSISSNLPDSGQRRGAADELTARPEPFTAFVP
jgi:hypothetical protein